MSDGESACRFYFKTKCALIFKRAKGSVLETFANSNTFEGIERLAKVKIVAIYEFVSLAIKSCTAIPLLPEPLSPSAL